MGQSSVLDLITDSELVDCNTGLRSKSITVVLSDSSSAEQGSVTSAALEPRRVSLDQLSETLEDIVTSYNKLVKILSILYKNKGANIVR